MSIDKAQTDPTLFRVKALKPFPDPALSQPEWLVLEVEYLNRADGLRKEAIHMPPEWHVPHQESVEAAIHSQLVYYVDDLDFSKTPSFPPTTDTTPERILRAISNNQIVSGQ